MVLLLAFSFFIRLWPILGNYFYFTIDQGRDAVFARDILQGHIFLLGPEAGLNLHHGVFWYYILAIFYKLFGGSPYGAVFFLILLNCLAIFLAVKFLERLGKKDIAYPCGFLLSILLPFYETSRYAFNPFLLPFLAILFIFSLCVVSEGKSLYILLAAASLGMVIHSNVTPFVPFFITFVLFSVWFRFQKKITFGDFIGALLIIFFFFFPHILSELSTNFSQTHGFLEAIKGQGSSLHMSTQGQFSSVLWIFYKMIGEVAFPQMPSVGVVIILIALLLFLTKKRNLPPFVFYTITLFLVSFIWFGINKGLESWHLIYLPPILLISFCLLWETLSRKMVIFMIIFMAISQLLYTDFRLRDYMSDRRDGGFLHNQIAVLDWIYQKSKGKGFFLYTYVPSVYDYHYQYLVFWYGLKRFGYVPCEYSTYPGTDASSYVPDSGDYQKPVKKCTNLRFLIMEKAVVPSLEDIWYKDITKGTTRLDRARIGDVEVEMRD